MTSGVGAGRPPKPAAIHRIQGTFRPDRHGGDELFETATLECPVWIKGPARRWWKELAALLGKAGVSTTGDQRALELLVKAYEEWRTADAAIAKAGSLTYETDSGVLKTRPEVAIRNAAFHNVRAALAMFGLDPQSRAKIRKQAEEDEDPLNKFLPGRKAG